MKINEHRAVRFRLKISCTGPYTGDPVSLGLPVRNVTFHYLLVSIFISI